MTDEQLLYLVETKSEHEVASELNELFLKGLITLEQLIEFKEV